MRLTCVLLQNRLPDKLELALKEVRRMGYAAENVSLIRGVRAPQYDAKGE